MTNSSGTIVARYDYDPFGRTTLVSGTDLATFQYADMYKHQPSGLYLEGRPYNPDTATWIGRDSMGERGGINLYQYVLNDPINYYDPTGEAPVAVTASEFAGGNERGHMPSAYPAGGAQVNADAPGVALPGRVPPGTTVRVTNPATGQSVVCPVRDVGPHNVNDPYWNTPGQRPAAEAQHAAGTPAQNGHVPANPAGVDLTPATMNAIGVHGAENTRQAPVIIEVIPPPPAPAPPRRP